MRGDIDRVGEIKLNSLVSFTLISGCGEKE